MQSYVTCKGHGSVTIPAASALLTFIAPLKHSLGTYSDLGTVQDPLDTGGKSGSQSSRKDSHECKYWRCLVRYLDMILRAATTNYHKPSGFQQQKCIQLAPGRQSLKSRCRHGWFLLQGQSSPRLVAAINSWLVASLQSVPSTS